MAGEIKLTVAQKRILIYARDKGSVQANGRWKRPCAILVDAGLLDKIKGRTRLLTESGRALVALPACGSPSAMCLEVGSHDGGA